MDDIETIKMLEEKIEELKKEIENKSEIIEEAKRMINSLYYLL